MTKEEENIRTTIEILGKTFQIKCSPNDVESLQRSAMYLEDKMNAMREEGKVLSLDRIAIITALNITHQFLMLESQTRHEKQTMTQRLNDIHTKMDASLSKQAEAIFAE